MTTDPFAAPIVYEQINEIAKDFIFYLHRSESANQRFTIGIQGPARYGKTTAVTALGRIADDHKWLVVQIKVGTDAQPGHIFYDFIRSWLHQASNQSRQIYSIYYQYVVFRTQEVGFSSDPDKPDHPILEVLLLFNRQIEPDFISFQHDYATLHQLVMEHNFRGSLFVIDTVGDISPATQDALRKLLTIEVRHPAIFIVKSEFLPHSIDYDRSYTLQALSINEIKEFLVAVFQNQQIENTLPEQIYELTKGIPKVVKTIVEELYYLYTQDTYKTQLIRLTRDLLETGRILDTSKEITKAILRLPMAYLVDLGYLLKFENWSYSEITSAHVINRYLEDSQTFNLNDALTFFTQWLTDTVQTLVQAGILTAYLEAGRQSFTFTGGEYQRILIHVLLKDTKARGLQPAIETEVLRPDFCETVLRVIHNHVTQVYGFKLITIMDTQDDVDLKELCRDWVNHIRDGAFDSETGYIIESYRYKEQPSDYLLTLVDAISDREYVVLGQQVKFAEHQSSNGSYAILMLKSADEIRPSQSGNHSNIENLLIGIPQECLVTIPKIIFENHTIETIDSIYKRAYERGNFKFANELLSALRKAGVQAFTGTQKGEKPEVALSYFQRAIELPVAPQSELDRGLVINNYAFTTAALGDYQNAIRKWNEVIAIYDAINVDISYTYQNLGFAYAKIGQYKKALETTNLAILKDNHRNSSVGVLYVKFCQKRDDLYLEDWRWEVAYAPQVLTAALCTKAAILFSLNEDEEVFSTLLDALILSPNSVYVHRAFGWYYISIGDKERAISSFAQAKEYAKTDPSDYPCYDEEIDFVSNLQIKSPLKQTKQKRSPIRSTFIIPIRSILSDENISNIESIEVKLEKNSKGQYSFLNAKKVIIKGEPLVTIFSDSTSLSLLQSNQLAHDDEENWVSFNQCTHLLQNHELDLLQSLMLEWIGKTGGKLYHEEG